jgi:hypothetical protein
MYFYIACNVYVAFDEIHILFVFVTVYQIYAL